MDDAVPSLRATADSVPQDWARLAAYLRAQGFAFEPEPAPRQFAGGFANLNYLVRIGGRDAVLRRPPPGPLPPGAYDMGREARILQRLWEQFPLAPRSLHLCLDPTVLGAPFQVTEYRRGVSLRATLPPAVAADAARCAALGRMLTDVLAQLHSVDPARVGLAELGRPAGFLERAVAGWSERAHLAIAGAGAGAGDPTLPRLVESVSDWLRQHLVPDGPAVLLHNDFKLDNLLLDPDTLAPVALLDWDQGTRGDARFDLATLLSYWTEADDPPALQRMAQMPTATAGFPTRREAAEAYADATGADLSDFAFHRVLALFKTAVIFQQLHARWRAGGTTDPRYAGFGDVSRALLDLAQDVAAGRTF